MKTERSVKRKLSKYIN